MESREDNTPLHVAAGTNNTTKLSQLLADQQCDPNAQNKEGDTPLHIAVRNRYEHIVMKLSSCGKCNPNVQNREGDTPLHIAVRIGYVQDKEIVTERLSCGKCNPDIQNREGDTPLHIAAGVNKTAALSQLLECKQCDPNIRNEEGDTPLHIVARNRYGQYEDIVTKLLSCGKCSPDIQNREGDTPLHIAVRAYKTAECYAQLDIPKYFLLIALLLERKCGINIPNKKGETAQEIPLNMHGDCLLHLACLFGNVDISGYIITYLRLYPSAVKLHQNIVVIVHLLTAYEECNPNILNREGDTPLHIAVRIGYVQHKEIVTKLLSCGKCNPDIQNRKGETPLHIAVRRNNAAALSQLLDHKRCNPNVQNEEGDTLLHIAVRNRYVQHEDIVMKLSSCGKCNPNIQNREGDTPLHIAARENNMAALSYMLAQKQCKACVWNKEGHTPVDVAIASKNFEAVFRLLPHAEDIISRKGSIAFLNMAVRHWRDDFILSFCQDYWGDTPLHIAARLNSKFLLSYLLGLENIDLNAQNRVDDTPLHIAVKHELNEAVVQLLSCRNCDPNIQNRQGCTPLHIAAGMNKTATLSQLLDHKHCNLNAQNKDGDSSLHIACHKNFSKVIRLLLERQCSTNIPNKKGEIAQEFPVNKDGDCLLHLACQWGDVGIVRYLITNQRCNPNIGNSFVNTPLHIAVTHYETEETIAQLLACEECNPNILNREGDTPLHIAAGMNTTAALSQLLDHEHCNPNVQNEEGDTPLHIAVRNRYVQHEDIVMKLSSCWKCNPNIQNRKGDTPLHIAAGMNKTVALSKLLDHEHCNPNVRNEEGDTPLHIAVRIRYVQHKDIVTELSSCWKCNPNIQNRKGDTPLHIAAAMNITAALSQLLDHEHCNPNAQNKEGDTPLHIAVRGYKTAECDAPLDIPKYFLVIALLLERKCGINIPNKIGETAQEIPLNQYADRLLHLACRLCNVDITGYIITYLRPTVKLHQNIDIVVHLLTAYEDCNPNFLNREGDTPLHIAARENKTAILSHLLDHKRCDPNVQNKEGDTPLYIAVRNRYEHIVVKLSSCGKCNPNIQNREGDTPLHIAVRIGYVQDKEIVTELLSCGKCNPDIQNREGDTPLHIAAGMNKTATLSKLLDHKQCNPNIRNKEGDTPLHIVVRNRYGQHDNIDTKLLSCGKCNPDIQNRDGDTPLHIAVRVYKTAECDAPVDIPKYFLVIALLLERKCGISIPNKKGETAQEIPLNKYGDRLLHLACRLGNVDISGYIITYLRPYTAKLHQNIDIVVHLLTACEECDPNMLNREGDTPLHIAARENKTVALSHLLDHKQCDPNVQNKAGDTPLHIVVVDNQTAAISQLITHKRCNLNVQNVKGDTPLHIAVTVGNLQLCEMLMTKVDNVNTLNEAHLTPVLAAIKHKRPSIAKALLQHKKCDLSLHDSDGNTALHLACIGGETQSEMVEIAKQLLITVDPSPVNSAGQTPIELTTNYQIIQAISHFILCKTKHSVQTYINIFVVGNPETGMSTLVKAICYEAGFWWKLIPKFMRRVRNVPSHTAGIIPTTFQSKTFGNTVLYDLAGQIEYYTSHAAVIQSTVISTPPAFIFVVNISESEEKISETLRYWWSFINNHAARASARPQVILVGSHADKVKSRGGIVQEKISQISALLQHLPTSFHFAGQIALDCRDPASGELQLFCSMVNKSCTVLRQMADVDLHCHVLYAFLLERFPGEIACTVSDIATVIQESDTLLPQNANSLIPLISTLSDKGLLLLVKDSVNSEDSWVILQKQALLSKINGTIFAPKSFSQHRKHLSSSTGVVPLLKLKIEFPDYNSTMIAKFLTHLEFCFKVDDHETLELLKDELYEENMPQSLSEEFYFFPALVSVENPLHVWEQDDSLICQCGWFYRCIQHDQFLTTQFLHVLILRLAFSFALKLDQVTLRKTHLLFVDGAQYGNVGLDGSTGYQLRQLLRWGC